MSKVRIEADIELIKTATQRRQILLRLRYRQRLTLRLSHIRIAQQVCQLLQSISVQDIAPYIELYLSSAGDDLETLSKEIERHLIITETIIAAHEERLANYTADSDQRVCYEQELSTALKVHESLRGFSMLTQKQKEILLVSAIIDGLN